MSAYEKLAVHEDSKYEEHLKNAEKLDIDFFDKEKILTFGEEYGIMPGEAKEHILKAWEELKDDEDYKRIAKAIYYFMKNDIVISKLAPDFDKEPVKAEFVSFFPIWYMAEEFANDAAERGVPKEIVSRTLMAICGCVLRNEGYKGRVGTSGFFTWLPYYPQGKIFRINDFEYENAKHDGKSYVGVHIPAKTKLDVLDNLKSFKEGMDFFDKYYPELNMTGMVCESWMLSTEVEEVMGGKTNVARFGDMFDRYDIGDTKGEGVFRFVFGLVNPYPPVEELPENTSMQRKMKEYMLSGKRVYAKGGFISREKLDKMIKELED